MCTLKTLEVLLVIIWVATSLVIVLQETQKQKYKLKRNYVTKNKTHWDIF